MSVRLVLLLAVSAIVWASEPVVPAIPPGDHFGGWAGLLNVPPHYEPTLCAKAFGRQVSRKMVAGNGVVEVKLTPAVEGNKTVRLSPQVVRMDADGSLGELPRSGQLGERVLGCDSQTPVVADWRWLCRVM